MRENAPVSPQDAQTDPAAPAVAESRPLPSNAAPTSAGTLAAKETPLPTGAEPTSTPGANPPKVGKIAPPSVAQLRDEVAQDPHKTPDSLLRFGAQVGARMKEANQSESLARDFLGELGDCARAKTGSVPVQSQALCLDAAQSLAKKWPSLQAPVKELFKSANPDAVRLLTSPL